MLFEERVFDAKVTNGSEEGFIQFQSGNHI
jgi:hypothetical protein